MDFAWIVIAVFNIGKSNAFASAVKSSVGDDGEVRMSMGKDFSALEGAGVWSGCLGESCAGEQAKDYS